MPALMPTSDNKNKDQNTEYTLKEAYPSCWVTVNNISVYIVRTDEGVVVDLYALGCEDEQASIGSTWAMFQEASEEINERNAKSIGA